MKIGDRIFVRGYIDEIRKDTVIVRNDGGYFGTVLSEVTGELPSAQPERKKGHWTLIDGHMIPIYKCSQCNNVSLGGNFCNNCGADMRGDNNEIN